MREWAEAIDAWMLTLQAAGRPKSTQGLRRYQLTRLAAAMVPARPWDVTGDQLVEWVASMPWGRESRRSYRSAIRGFFSWARRVGHITIDPALELPPVAIRPPSPRPAPRDAYHAALAGADERLRLMLRLAAELGLRRGEVAALHADALEREIDGWAIRVRGKGDRNRRLPVDDTLAAAVRRRGPGPLFPGRIDGHLSPAHVGRLVSRALPGVWTMHTLRHRFATVAYAHDRDVFAVQELLGHASSETTRRYVQVPVDALRRTVAAVAAAS